MYSIYMEMLHDSSYYYSQFQLSFRKRKRNYSKESKRLIIFSLYSIHCYSNCYSIRMNFLWNEPISLHIEQSSFSWIWYGYGYGYDKNMDTKNFSQVCVGYSRLQLPLTFLNSKLDNQRKSKLKRIFEFVPWWVLINLTTMTNLEITVPICLPTNCYNM